MIEAASEIGNSGKTSLRVEDKKDGESRRASRQLPCSCCGVHVTHLFLLATITISSAVELASQIFTPHHHSLFVAYALGFSGLSPLSPEVREPHCVLKLSSSLQNPLHFFTLLFRSEASLSHFLLPREPSVLDRDAKPIRWIQRHTFDSPNLRFLVTFALALCLRSFDVPSLLPCSYSQGTSLPCRGVTGVGPQSLPYWTVWDRVNQRPQMAYLQPFFRVKQAGNEQTSTGIE
jgi:hypothetical protein